jgi:hypothetical protein
LPERIRERGRRSAPINAIVGENIAVYNNEITRTILPPMLLPKCDVLQLDCGGAEVKNLQEMLIRLRVIAVETHAVFGAPTDKVHAILESIGYEVTNLGWAESRLLETCIKHGVEVLVGYARE